jgi:hypothetical protein
VTKQHHFRIVLPGAKINDGNYPGNFHSCCSPPLLSIRLLTLKPIKLLPLKHPAIDSHSWLRIAYDRIVRHTPAFLATIKAYRLIAPHIRLCCIAFNVDFIWFVVRPECAVAPADGAEAFEGGLAEGWEGEPDGFAVAGCSEVGLL